MLVLDDKAAHIRNAKHYRQYRQQLAKKDTIKKNYAISTKNNIREIKVRWKKYIIFMLIFYRQESWQDAGSVN